jgi:hypothetical protein
MTRISGGWTITLIAKGPVRLKLPHYNQESLAFYCT